jgi:DNA-binding transcriptional MerR regulator
MVMAKNLYSIGEVAEMTGVSVKTIRFYSDSGLVPPADKTETRYRLYSHNEIWRLELVRTLRHFGFSLEEIGQILKGAVSPKKAMEWQMEALELQIARLLQLRDLLRQADTVEEETESLKYLHAIREAVTSSVEERSQYFVRKLLRATSLEEERLNNWMKEFVKSARSELPVNPTAEQAAAWVELINLLDSPEYAGKSVPRANAFWQATQGVDLSWFMQEMLELGEQAKVLLIAGITAESPEFQIIMGELVALYARLAKHELTAEFVQELCQNMATWFDEQTWKVYQLMEKAGWNGEGLSEYKAQQAYLEGVKIYARNYKP